MRGESHLFSQFLNIYALFMRVIYPNESPKCNEYCVVILRVINFELFYYRDKYKYPRQKTIVGGYECEFNAIY